MLKIIELHPSQRAQHEYLVLQNQGLDNINLRGYVLSGDSLLLSHSDPAAEMFVFREEIAIPPYGRVVLFTGTGEDAWVPTNDGKRAYCAFWNRTESVWNHTQQVYLLQLASSRRVALPLPMSA